MENNVKEYVEIKGRKLEAITVTVNEKQIKVRELFSSEFDEIHSKSTTEEEKKEAVKKEIMLTTGLTEDEFKNITFKEKMIILKTINKLNDFQGGSSQND